MPERAKPGPAWWGGLAVAMLLGLVTQLEVVGDHDLWWHLRTGEWTLAHLGPPRVNTFSHTEPNHPWIVFEWLTQVVMALCWRVAGVWGIYAWRLVLVQATVGLWYALGVRLTGRVAPVLLAIAVMLAFMRWRFGERPELFSYFFLALYGWLLFRQPAPGPRTWAALAVSQVLWANLHGYFFLGPGLVGWWALRRMLQGDDLLLTLRRFALAAGLLALCAINPYGPRLLLALVSHNHSVVLDSVNEFQVYTVYTDGGSGVVFLAFLGVCMAAMAGKARGALLADIPFMLTVLSQGLRYERFMWLLPAFFFPVVFLGMKEVATLAWRQGPLPRLFIWAGVLGFGFWATPRPPALGIFESTRPVRAMRFVTQHRLPGPIFNEYDEGGWLLWHYWPRFPTFMDGRFAFSEKFYGGAVNRPPHLMRPVLERFGVNLVLLRRNQLTREDFYALFPAGGDLALVWFDETHYVLARQPARFGLKAFSYLCPCPDGRYLKQFAAGPERDGVTQEINHLRALHPGSAFAFHGAMAWALNSQNPALGLNLLKQKNPPLARAEAAWLRTVFGLMKGEKPAGGAVVQPPPSMAFIEPTLNAELALGHRSPALQRARARALTRPDDVAIRAWLKEHEATAASRRRWAREWRRVRMSLAQANHHAAVQLLEQGGLESALHHAKEAQALAPERPEVRALLEQLQQKTGAVFPEDNK